MFSRLSNSLLQSSKVLPRRLFSAQPNRRRIIGLGSALGLSAVGAFSVNALLAQPLNLDEETQNRMHQHLEQAKTNLDQLRTMFVQRFGEREVSIPGVVKNSAFVFIKPHAATDAVTNLVKNTFEDNGFNIIDSGTLTGGEIDEKMYIDQHYYSIASKATLLKPAQLNVPVEKFKKKFGLEWNDALAQGVVYNAKDACELLGLDSSEINTLWAKCKKDGKMIKFGGGFYCGLIDSVPNQPPIYVFNGFFMSMRSKFVAPDAVLKYFVVEWDAKQMNWEDFRGQFLGPTDPASAPAKSLRGLVYNNWESLGLSSQPNVGDNGVHASASPFEALAERMNWLEAKLDSDTYGKLLLESGISEAIIKQWSVDPQVIYGSKSLPIKMSLFDSIEDTDSDMCLARLMMIASQT